MYIWNVKLELEWSYAKGEWEDEREYNVAAKTAEAAVEKAKHINARFCKPWKDEEELITLTGVRLVSVERSDEIDG